MHVARRARIEAALVLRRPNLVGPIAAPLHQSCPLARIGGYEPPALERPCQDAAEHSPGVVCLSPRCQCEPLAPFEEDVARAQIRERGDWAVPERALDDLDLDCVVLAVALRELAKIFRP